MDFSLFLLAFTMLWEMSEAIQCYKCVPSSDTGSGVALCAHFDGNARYIVDCPYSTGCLKKETILDRGGETYKAIERGCANQIMDGEQEKINGHWEHVKKIHEAYEVGCHQDPPEFGKLTRSTECFCRGDLCNKSCYITSSVMGIASVLLMLLIMR